MVDTATTTSTTTRHMRQHTMELPRKIQIGEGNIHQFGGFLESLGIVHTVSLISGSNVQRALKSRIQKSIEGQGVELAWHTPPTKENSLDAIEHVQTQVKKDGSDMIVGIGGGKSVDTAKMIAYSLKKPFVSLPTAASHDGMASPFVSVKGGDKPHSIVASTPMGVFVDINIVKKAPAELLASGCGDLVANTIAVKDWKLGHAKNGEYYGTYAADLAMMSASMILDNASEFAKSGVDVRLVVEGLISAGVAACIAGSSRPCSGAEHLFSHALDRIAPGVGLHGQKCGLGSIMMAKLQNQDWKKIQRALNDVGAPTTAEQVGLESKDVIEALCIAQGLRPSRYTILKKVGMTKRKALNLAKSTGVI